MVRRTPLLVLLATLLLAWPAVSLATVTVDRTTFRYQPGGGGSGFSSLGVLRLRGDSAGDAVGVRRRGGRLVVTASRGTLRARGTSCRQRGPRAVSCPGGLQSLDALLRAGDDTLVLHTRFGRRTVDGGRGDDVLEDRFTRCIDGCSPVPGVGILRGGAGDDRLRGQELSGGDGDDVLVGTAARDLLEPGTGADRVVAGPGDDVVRLTDGTPDQIDGGAGVDEVSYGLSLSPLTLDLVAGLGQAGDRFTSIEALEGGVGADVLRGDDGPNLLRPGTRDTVFGGGGDDLVEGDALGATVDAGPGDDRIAVRLANAPVGTPGNDLRCGTGSDVVTGPAVGDLVRADCERIRGAAILTTRALSADRSALSLTFLTAGVRACRVQAVAFADPTRARTLGQAEAELPPTGGSITVPLVGPLAGDEISVQYRLSGCLDGADAATTGPFRLGVPAST